MELAKEVMAADKSIVDKILRNEREREELYPEQSILDELRSERVEDIAKAEKVLGRILDKVELAREFLNLIPLYYDDAFNWWAWDSQEYYWRMVDEVDIMNMVSGAAEVNVINSKEKAELLNALKMAARCNKPKVISSRILQFRRELVNFDTGDRFAASSDYFVTNPIPFKLGRYPDTEKFDKLFAEWVAPDEVQSLYEVLAYCLLPEYPIERIIVLLGAGANGKSTFLKILYTLLGMRNICSTSLEALSKSRFETTRLYKKLAVIIAETNLSNLENSQIIKRLSSGKDVIPIEFKNKGLTEFVNYAKLIIATNNLPPTDDKTDGFYRRWKVIEFPNQFEKEIDVLSDLTTNDYENLACRCLNVLDDLLKRRCFTNDGDIASRRVAYENKSNPFDKFWEDSISEDNPDSDIPSWEFEKEYNIYLKANRLRSVSSKTIGKLMKDKGIEQGSKRVSWTDSDIAQEKKVRIWKGLSWK